MNKEQQRIAIAEACGLKLFPMGPSDKQWLKPKKGGGVEQVPLPDYLNDLNAMHEAEKVLSDQQVWDCVVLLVGWKCPPSGFPLLSRSQSIALHKATAAQRAEAFLKTCNLWEGDDKL
jgi:hypothetical protein